jgi:hypothetical protein
MDFRAEFLGQSKMTIHQSSVLKDVAVKDADPLLNMFSGQILRLV